MADEVKHTPLPWKVRYALLRPQFPGSRIIEVQDSDGDAVVNWRGFDDAHRLKKTHLANAKIIVEAVNNHASLRIPVQTLVGALRDTAPLVHGEVPATATAALSAARAQGFGV